MSLLFRWLISALAVLAASYLLPGVHVTSFIAAAITALVIGIVNVTIKPVLFFLTLPLNLITLGLFTFVINAILIMFTATIVPGFTVESFWWALLFSLVLSIINSFLHQISD